jgi:predicted RNA-binding Zn-ribbon protein involved in translation (DUF1610 family)
MTGGTEATDRSGMTGLLARRLRDAGRGPDEAFTVAELRRSLLPYPRCRTALGLASKAEYDVALLRLLHGEGLLEADDPELDEDVERELESPEPALGVLDDHAATALRPGPRLEEELRADAAGGAGPPEPGPGADGAGGPEAGPRPGAADERDGDATDPSAGPTRSGDTGDGAPDGRTRRSAGDGGAAGVVFRSSGPDPADGSCAACGGDLPDARGVRFCPHCGDELEALRCRGCGEEMAAGWRFCPFCGSERHE